MNSQISSGEDIHLSVVATSRNDNHGGSLTARMQHFVDGFVAQCKRHHLRAELILVEWNPPSDRVPLAQELRWPEDCGPCEIRIITVPARVHARFDNSEKIPLFQMIAKNVGIRRARGRFILATNIDILFSDGAIRFMRDRLREGLLYRTDRVDVPANVPASSDFSRVLEFCTSEGFRIHGNPLTVRRQETGWRRLDLLKVERGPRLLYLLHLGRLALHSLECQLSKLFHLGQSVLRVLLRLGGLALHFPGRLSSKLLRLGERGLRLLKLLFRGLSRPRHAIRTLARIAFGGKEADWDSRIRIGRKQKLRQTMLFLWHLTLGLARMSWSWTTNRVRLLGKKLVGAWPFARIIGAQIRLLIQRLMIDWPFTNACGDFTLLSKRDWFKLRGYAEWPIFSWHLDSLLIFHALGSGIAQHRLAPSERIYHIEHGRGYTPEAAVELFSRLREQGVPFLSNDDIERLRLEIEAKERSHAVSRFNEDSWGLVHHQLPEAFPAEKARISA